MANITINDFLDCPHNCDVIINGVQIKAQRYSIEHSKLFVWFRAEIIIEHKLKMGDIVKINHMLLPEGYND